jgi:hypothetical protein
VTSKARPGAHPVPGRRPPGALAIRYGLGRALFEWTFDRMRIDMCYLEIVPGKWHAASSSGRCGDPSARRGALRPRVHEGRRGDV